ncbi:hypothetical protein QF212_21480, partial [Providencia stuartii]|nr:hypothetical protein [Providencia stuartii]
GNLSLSAYEAGKNMLVTAKNNYVLNAAQAKGLETTLAQIRADKAHAMSTQEALGVQLQAARTEERRAAIRQQQAANYAKIIELNKAETATVNELTAAQKRLNYAARAMRGTLSLLGGPVGAAMMAGGALYYFSEKAEEARDRAINLKDAVLETTEALMRLSQKELTVKLVDAQEELQNTVTERNKMIKELRDKKDRIKELEGGLFGDVFNQVPGLSKDVIKLDAQLEKANANIEITKEKISRINEAKDKLASGEGPTKAPDPLPLPELTGGDDKDKGKNKGLNDYQQLRKSIESEHFSSLQKILADEKENNDKLIELNKKG